MWPGNLDLPWFLWKISGPWGDRKGVLSDWFCEIHTYGLDGNLEGQQPEGGSWHLKAVPGIMSRTLSVKSFNPQSLCELPQGSWVLGTSRHWICSGFNLCSSLCWLLCSVLWPNIWRKQFNGGRTELLCGLRELMAVGTWGSWHSVSAVGKPQETDAAVQLFLFFLFLQSGTPGYRIMHPHYE